jgi:GNAT superfamily N-acetyltransferase
MDITYRLNHSLNPQDVARVFNSSGIRRPTDDLTRIALMFEAPGLILSAWDQDLLVGVSRSLTDHAYCCYLSDLAVVREYQGCGIGRELIARTRGALGDHVTLILLSAPEAMTYYPQLGFEHADNAFIIRRSR